MTQSQSAPEPAAPNLPNTKEELQRLLNDLYSLRTNSTPGQRVAVVLCGGYTRLSKSEPGKIQYSFDVQIKEIEKYVRQQGWKLIQIYRDEDASGINSKRHGLQAAIRDIKSKRYDVLLLHRSDQAFRNVSSFLKLLTIAHRYNVRIVFLDAQFDTDLPSGRLMLIVLAAFAEFFARLTSQRVREMKQTRFEHGLPNGQLPLGYCNGRCSHCTDANGPGYCPRAGGPDLGAGRIAAQHPLDHYAILLMMYLAFDEHRSDQEIADYLNSNTFTLPDGMQVKFRSRGIPGRYDPGPFSESTVRIALRNIFYAGFVARYPSQPLNLDDDPEHPYQKPERPNQPTPNRRVPLQLIKGQHVPIVPFEVWQQIQLARHNKGRTPTSSAKPKRINPFTKIAHCWECYDYDRKISNLRCNSGSTDQRAYARCGRYQDSYRARQRPATPASDRVLAQTKLTPGVVSRDLAERHRNIPQHQISDQIETLAKRLVIPAEWYELIIAYFLTDDGLLDFKFQSHELSQEIERIKQLHSDRLMNRAEAVQRVAQINARRQQLQPSAHPLAATLLPLLQDFEKLWGQLEPIEQRGLLTNMFSGIFFDAHGQQRLVLANEPFDHLLHLADDQPALG